MKNLFFALLLMTSPLVYAEGAGGHGGDPFEVYAESYPDQTKLDAGLTRALTVVTSSVLPASLKNEIVGEISTLRAASKFLYLESLLVVQVEAPDTYRIPTDLRTFTALGGMTSHERGSPVYLSKRTLAYTTDEFARLVIHEVLHHVLEDTLAESETYINALVSDLWATGGGSERITKALENGFYVAPGAPIDIARMFRSRYWFDVWMKWCNRKDVLGWRPGVESCSSRIRYLSDNLQRAIGSDASEMTLLELVRELSRAIYSTGVYKRRQLVYDTNVLGFVTRSAELSGLPKPTHGYCRVRVRAFSSCPVAKLYKVKDFFKFD